MTVLLGRTSAGTNADFNGGARTAAWKFTAVASGRLGTIYGHTKVANPTGAVKLGIYDDDAINTRPGNLLAVATATNARDTAPFAAVLAAPVAITAGTIYWLAWRNDTEQFDWQGDSAGSYKDIAADFPTPFGVGSTGNFNAIIWGEDVAVVTAYTAAPMKVSR